MFLQAEAIDNNINEYLGDTARSILLSGNQENQKTDAAAYVNITDKNFGGEVFYSIHISNVPCLVDRFSTALAHPDELNAIDVLGTLLWCVGLYWEVVGDWHIRFPSKKKGDGVLDKGLGNIPDILPVL